MLSKYNLPTSDSYTKETEIFHDYSTYEITYENVSLPFRLVLVDASMNIGPRSCTSFAEIIWENIKTFAFQYYANVCVPLDTPTVLYLHHYRSTIDSWKTNDPCEDFFSEIISLQSESSSTTTFSKSCKLCLRQPPTLEIWLRIRSSISLSIYQSSHLQVERYLTSMFMRQNRLFFPSISWFRKRTSHYNVLSCETNGASATNDFTIACPHTNDCGAHSTCNTASYEDIVATLRYERDKWWCFL